MSTFGQQDQDSAKLAEFFAKLQSLNAQFASWVTEQRDQHAKELWLDGVEDYRTYANQLLQEYSTVLKKRQGQPHNEVNSTSGAFPKFGTQQQPQTAAAPSSFFGASLQPQQLHQSAPLFGGGFGAGASGTATAMTTATTTTAAAVEDGDGGDDETPQPSKSELREAEGANVLFRAKAKLYLTEKTGDKPAQWVERGIGQVTVRQPDKTKKPFMVFTNEAGKVRLNTAILKEMKPSIRDNKYLLFTAALHNEQSGQTELKLCQFRMQQDRAQELEKLLQHHSQA